MRRAFIIVTGTGVRKDTRELTSSATEALRLVLAYMKLRRPGVRIESLDGNPVSFFELKKTAEAETGKENASRT
jgi:hypothetical protein